MWFVFPQLAGLGHSETAQFYALHNLEAAKVYLAHPVLGARLKESTIAFQSSLLTVDQVFPVPDNLKFHSSMTLFALAAGPESVFRQVLSQHFQGAGDTGTLRLLID